MRGRSGEDVLHRPHLVLADARRDDHVVPGDQLLELLHHPLRLEEVALPRVAERELVPQPPRSGASMPRAPGPRPRDASRSRRVSSASAFLSGPTTGTSASRSFEISAASMSRCTIGRAGREGRELAGDAVVESRTDRDEHVAGVHRDVRPLRAVHPGPAEVQLVRLGERALAHQGRDHREPALLGEPSELLAGIGVQRPAPDVEDGLLGLCDHGRRLADLERMHLRRRLPAGKVDASRGRRSRTRPPARRAGYRRAPARSGPCGRCGTPP